MKYKYINGSKIVRKWIKPHMVKGYYKNIRINVKIKIRIKQLNPAQPESGLMPRTKE
jgi:hypothetical protein